MTCRVDRLDSEIRHHLDLLTAEYESRGLSPDEARFAARRAFGDVEPMKERYRDGARLRWLEDVGRDMRYAVRGLRRNPGFTAVAMLTLAFGIGANTALFSVLDALMIRKLPVDRPDDLISLAVGSDDIQFSYPFYREVRDGTASDLDVATTTGALRKQMRVRQSAGVSGTEPIQAEAVSGNYFPVVGTRTSLGRPLVPGDDSPSAPGAVVLSHAFWMRRFGGDADIIGRTITLDDDAFTIVGVAAPGFSGYEVARGPDLWWPIHRMPLENPRRPHLVDDPDTELLMVFGRLQAGADRSAVATRLKNLYRANVQERFRVRSSRQGFVMTPGWRATLASELQVRSAASGETELRYRYGRPLTVLVVLVAIVLLVACANVANLLLARAAARQREMSVRLAIGAGRRRIVRQLLTESLFLALVAGSLGLLCAVWISRAMVSFVPDPRFVLRVGLDLRVLAFALAVSTVTGILFGVLPALTATRRSIAAHLAHQRATTGISRLALQNTLVVVQVALSMVVLVGAVLFVRTLQNLQTLDPGFQPAGLMVFRLTTPDNYGEERRSHVYRQVVEQTEALPESQAVTFSMFGLLSGQSAAMNVEVPGYAPSLDENMSVQSSAVGARFFEVMGIPILQGRALTAADARPDADRPLVVINETMARRFYGNDAVGKRFRARGGGNGYEIVGVAADAKYRNLKERPSPAFYEPFVGSSFNLPMQVEVRTVGNAPIREDVIRRVVRDIDPAITVLDVRTMNEVIDATIPQERLLSFLASLFGVLVLVVAAIGIYGVSAFAVSRRTNEIGVRMALGATRGAVLADVLAKGVVLAVAGVAVGAAVAALLTRQVGGLLYDVTPRDPATFALAAVVFGTVALLAAYVPARRATRVNPLVALRSE
jgi:predicted permease